MNNIIPEKNFAKDILWDVIGDNVLNRISQGFGKQNQGYFRISPILNPLYMGYSERKGIVYKFDLKEATGLQKIWNWGFALKEVTV